MRTLCIVLLLGLLFGACGGYTQTTQKADVAYLKFVGNISDISFSVDDGPTYAFDQETELYQLKPGQHRVKVFRNGQIIVDRLIVLDNQITKEISVP